MKRFGMLLLVIVFGLAGCCKQDEEAAKKQAEEMAKLTSAEAAARADAQKARADGTRALAAAQAATGVVEALKKDLEKCKADAEAARGECDKAKGESEKKAADAAAELEKCKAEAARAAAPPPVTDTAKAAVKASVEAQYATVARGDVAGWCANLAADAFFFGSAAFEAIQGKDAIQADLVKVFEPALKGGATFVVKSTNLQIGVSDDGKAAWMSDEVDFQIVMGDKTIPTPFRVTELLVEKDGQWQILATSWSHAVPNDEAARKAAEGKWPERAKIEDKVDAGAEPMAQVYNDNVNDVVKFLETVTDREDAFVFGTAAEEKIPGGKAIKAAFGDMVRAMGVTTAKAGGVRAGIAANGQVGYVAANLDFLPTVEGKKLTVPYRFLGIYLKEGEAWKLVQVHFSIGLAEEK